MVVKIQKLGLALIYRLQNNILLISKNIRGSLKIFLFLGDSLNIYKAILCDVCNPLIYEDKYHQFVNVKCIALLTLRITDNSTLNGHDSGQGHCYTKTHLQRTT